MFKEYIQKPGIIKYVVLSLFFIVLLLWVALRPVENYRVISGGTFSKNVYLFVTEDTAMVREYSPNADFNSEAFTVNEDGVIIVWFPFPPTEGLLAHEMEHATMMILSTCGVPHTGDTDEVYAYELQYLINEYHKKNNMYQNLHNWVFMYNKYTDTWKTTTRDNYHSLTNDSSYGVLSSKDINTLIDIIEKTNGDSLKIEKLIK